MVQKQNDISYLLSKKWWSSSLALTLSLAPKFFAAALLLSFSNFCSAYADTWLNSGIDLGAIQSSPEMIGKLLVNALILLAISTVGLITGLISLSLWMIKLTALSRQLLSPGSAFENCLKEIKAETKYFAGVWLVGCVYLLGPVLPLSTLLAFEILGNSRISVFGEPLLIIPQSWQIPSQILIGLLALITIDFTIVLTVYSAKSKVKATLLSSHASNVIWNSFVPLIALNLLLLILHLGISMPFLLFPAVPALTSLSKNLVFSLLSQLWFAITSVITWPLSIIIFAELLKPLMDKDMVLEKAAEQNGVG